MLARCVSHNRAAFTIAPSEEAPSEEEIGTWRIAASNHRARSIFRSRSTVFRKHRGTRSLDFQALACLRSLKLPLASEVNFVLALSGGWLPYRASPVVAFVFGSSSGHKFDGVLLPRVENIARC